MFWWAGLPACQTSLDQPSAHLQILLHQRLRALFSPSGWETQPGSSQAPQQIGPTADPALTCASVLGSRFPPCFLLWKSPALPFFLVLLGTGVMLTNSRAPISFSRPSSSKSDLLPYPLLPHMCSIHAEALPQHASCGRTSHHALPDSWGCFGSAPACPPHSGGAGFNNELGANLGFCFIILKWKINFKSF